MLDRDVQHVIGVLRGDWPRCPDCKRFYEDYQLDTWSPMEGGYCRYEPGCCPQCALDRLRDAPDHGMWRHFIQQIEDIIVRG